MIFVNVVRQPALVLAVAVAAAERRAIALDHLRQSLARARQVHAALDQPASPPGFGC